MKYFYDRFWDWNSQYRIDDSSYKWPAIKKLLPKKANYTFLDYGCGQGRMLSHIQTDNPKATLIGMDVSSVALKRAKKKIKSVKLLRVADGQPLPVPTRSIDFLICLDVVEHVYDTESLFKEFSRVLKPNGKILISTPYHGLIKNVIIALFIFETIYDPTGPHIRFFTKKSLSELLYKNSLVPTEYGLYGRIFPINRGMYVFGYKKIQHEKP